jgi:hypothetical protein
VVAILYGIWRLEQGGMEMVFVKIISIFFIKGNVKSNEFPILDGFHISASVKDKVELYRAEVMNKTGDERRQTLSECREKAFELLNEAIRIQKTLPYLPAAERQSTMDKINALDEEAILLLNNVPE